MTNVVRKLYWQVERIIIIIIIIIIIKGTISLGGGLGKVGVNRKWWCLAQSGWNHLTRRIDHLAWKRTQGAGIVKG